MNAIVFLTLVSMQDPATFTVGTATAARGQTAYGEIVVPAASDSGLRIPVVVVHGARPGKVVAFVAGSHGTEYASIIATQRLIDNVNARFLAGTVIIVPIINIPSIEQMVPHLNPIDRRNMNREYPGDSTGSVSQRAAFAITRAVVDPADVVVDLHGGDLDEDLRPYSYWFRSGKPAQDSASRSLAIAFGLDHIIVTDVNPSTPVGSRTLSGQTLARGKVAVVAEAGRSGLVLDEDVDALIAGSMNVLSTLGMIARHATHVPAIVWIGFGTRVAADSAGIFYATVARGARVKQGQVIGRTTDYFGRRNGEVHAPIDGVVTFIRRVPSMAKGATLADIQKVLTTVPPWVAP